jgi:hypothetical protein
MSGKYWSEKEINFLKKGYTTMSCSEIAKELGRTTRSVQHKFGQLELKRETAKIGDKFNRLTIQKLEMEKHIDQNCTFAYCICECGKEHRAKLTDVVSGHAKSCGCLKSESSAENCRKRASHNLSNSSLYRKWAGIKARCFYPSQPGYKDYGGRGITICDEWKNSFESFKDWALSNGYEENLTIERIDVNKNYCPENCKFITKEEQHNNTTRNIFITIFGETKNAKQWSKDNRCVCSYRVFIWRISVGWEPELALTKPERKINI